MANAPSRHRTLSYESVPPLAWITLNRPHADNRVDHLMAQELREVFELLEQEAEVRVLVIVGTGGVFSRGREPLPPDVRQSGGDSVAQWMSQRRAAWALGSVSVPVLAALNGDALDHGLELALACDMRIACRAAVFGVTDVSRGVVPWDGATQRLPRLIGRSRALDMLLTSRLVPAEEALEMGLVNSVVEPADLLQTARQVAESMAAGAPIPSRYLKEAVNEGMDMPLEQGLRLEADLNILLQNTKDREEGIGAFLDKAVPSYRGE